jgi:Ca2+-binding EF-hand superfamily protein
LRLRAGAPIVVVVVGVMTKDGERLLTHHKIQHMQNAFSLLDRNKDGKIDLKDLDIISDVFKGVKKDQLQEALRTVDLDEDDNLDMFEFQAIIAKTYETEYERKLEVASLFSFLQGVHNSQVSFETLVSMICKIDSEMTKKKVGLLFKFFSGINLKKAEDLVQSVFPGKQTIPIDEIYELFP